MTRAKLKLAPQVFDLQGVDSHEAFESLSGLPYLLFLDSAARSDPVHGRYSYITASPAEIIVANHGVTRLSHRDSANLDSGYTLIEESSSCPFSITQNRLERVQSERLPGFPPFQGGLAGLFGYELSAQIETLPKAEFDEFEVPDMAVGIFDWVIAFDHRSDRCHLLVQAGDAIDGARAIADAIRQRLDSPKKSRPGDSELPSPCKLQAPSEPLAISAGTLSNFSRREYIDAVSRAIEYIRAGDVFQVNVSQRLVHPLERDPFDFYDRLRRNNPEPFGAFFDLGEHVIASSSPEQFISLDGDLVLTRPIKGTRSRGYTPEEDSYRRVDLSESAKDQSENVMIVDLLRNDLSRVCTPGSVHVPRLFELERHPTVHHLVSEVRGSLKPGKTALDLLRATFPGGSITGAPKIRAMEIITELERTARGAYCGSLAWIAFHGGMGSSILIRTTTLSRGWIQLPVGGGIIAASRPVDEYEETLHKAAGMLGALA